MLNTVGGLPAHPLLAHVVAIFMPLSVVQVGHTGAEAVWGGMLCCR
jgi:hypothetical protein